MAPCLPDDKLQNILHSGCATFKRETVDELIKLGGDPLWRDENEISCIDRALANKNGILHILFK